MDVPLRNSCRADVLYLLEPVVVAQLGPQHCGTCLEPCVAQLEPHPCGACLDPCAVVLDLAPEPRPEQPLERVEGPELVGRQNCGIWMKAFAAVLVLVPRPGPEEQRKQAAMGPELVGLELEQGLEAEPLEQLLHHRPHPAHELEMVDEWAVAKKLELEMVVRYWRRSNLSNILLILIWKNHSWR